MSDDLAKTLEQLAAGTPYPPQAFYFVLQGMEFAKTHAQHEISPDAEGVRHFDAEDISWCLHDLAIFQFGENARRQLADWGITRTDEFGEIVFILVEADLIRASERDCPEEFHEVFRFEDEFQYGPHWEFEITEEDAAEAGSAAKKPLRTPPRFGLKTLLIVVTLFCVAAGWFGWRWRYAKFQKQLVADIRATGGLVFYEYSALRGPFGDDFHSNLAGVSLTNAKLTPELANRIARVKSLRTLQMYNSQIEPGAMPQIAALPQLASLQISGGEIHDERALAPLEDVRLLYLAVEKIALQEEHLRQLGRITHVQQLDLSDMPLSDDQLGFLMNLKQVRSLRLEKTAIRGTGLRQLAGMEHLELLDLSSTALDDRGLLLLPRLPRLKWLNLSNTKITDAAIKTVPKWPSLEYLYLNHTAMTDAAVPPLKQLPQLRYAFVDETSITEAAAEDFSQGNPNRRIVNTRWQYEKLREQMEATLKKAQLLRDDDAEEEPSPSRDVTRP